MHVAKTALESCIFHKQIGKYYICKAHWSNCRLLPYVHISWCTVSPHTHDLGMLWHCICHCTPDATEGKMKYHTVIQEK